MKKLILLFTFLLLIGCKERNTIENKEDILKSITIAKYNEGELVYVGDNPFIVDRYSENEKLYVLKHIGCRHGSCLYAVKETEISKEPKF